MINNRRGPTTAGSPCTNTTSSTASTCPPYPPAPTSQLSTQPHAKTPLVQQGNPPAKGRDPRTATLRTGRQRPASRSKIPACTRRAGVQDERHTIRLLLKTMPQPLRSVALYAVGTTRFLLLRAVCAPVLAHRNTATTSRHPCPEAIPLLLPAVPPKSAKEILAHTIDTHNDLTNPRSLLPLRAATSLHP